MEGQRWMQEVWLKYNISSWRSVKLNKLCTWIHKQRWNSKALSDARAFLEKHYFKTRTKKNLTFIPTKIQFDILVFLSQKNHQQTHTETSLAALAMKSIIEFVKRKSHKRNCSNILVRKPFVFFLTLKCHLVLT